MKNIFINSVYDGPKLRTNKQFCQPRINTTFKGEESLRYFAPIIWSSLPGQYKSINSLVKFKNEIKKWEPSACPCRLCKTYVAGVGYINSVQST